MKKFLLISLIVLIAVLVMAEIFLFYPKEIKIQDVKTVYTEKPLKIDITYPQIVGMDDFNAKVKAIIDKEFNSFKENSLANDAAIKQIDPESYAKFPREYELNISYKTGEVDQNIISLIFEEYNFEGGAHGSTIFIPLNYNVNPPTGGKTEIKLADLFSEQADYLKKISDFCIANLTKQMTASGAIDMSDSSWINNGAGPKEENYSIFLINKDSIVFYFPQYQVAAYAAGDFQVAYPR